MRIALLALAASCLPAGRAAAQVPPGCPPALGTANIIEHDFTVSFCELCSVGTVRIEIENPFRPSGGVGDFSGLVVTENLMASGLTYVPGSTRFSGVGVVAPPVVQPVVSGPNGSILTWTLGPGFVLPAQPGATRPTLIIEFDVERHASLSEEGLVAASRTIESNVSFLPECSTAGRFTSFSGPGVLPLREPIPQIIKRGRNLDAGQGSSSYSDPVYGHANDDVIWRIQVRNTDLAPLQDFRFDDSIVPGNFDIDYVCATEASATSAANGAAPATCVALPGTTTSIADFDVRAAFGGSANPYIVAPPWASGFYYLVGKITDSCNNRVNTVSDVQWGCQSEPPAGGIAATSTGTTPGDTALLSTRSVETGLDIDVALTGTSAAQPMGSKGTVTLTIRNQSGGTIKHDGGIRLRELLPSQYVIDTTFTPTLSMAPAYGNAYSGMIDRLAWTNPVPGTFPLTTTNPALPLANTDLQFLLTSSNVHPQFPDQFNMIRHGDVVTIRLRTVLIAPQYYDKVANLDVRTEAPNSDPPGTDPTASFPISNRVEIWFEEFCTTAEHHRVFDDTATARPEDLDVDIVGSELVFILTNTGDPLPLTVTLRNNGGHDAADYQAYVTLGQAMTVQTAPAGCTPTENPPLLPVWRIPVTLPATAAVYRCDRGVISPGETERLEFQVVKNTAASFDDDLTFRADVIGEIALSNGTRLWFPTPTPRPDGITDRANDYTIDGIWARVIGYNLFKRQLGFCTENNPPPASPDRQVQIGEECSFNVESGGWFGFRTPGFTYIAVQRIQLVDRLPDGQGYISSTDPLLESTPAIQGVSLNPPPQPLSDAFFDWTFNTLVPAERITEKDHWFRADVTTRLLNDPIDASGAPNQHAAVSTNVLTSTFEAVFFNQSTHREELYNLGPNTVGYPREVHRRVDLVVTEPRLTVAKEVCNETRYGVGPACSNFVPLANDGDAFDTYVYRIRVANEGAGSGVTRAPAYDVTVTSVADPSDQLFVDPLPADALDNDADLLIDGGDAAGEGLISDNTVLNATPAQVVAAYTHSDALLRVDAGQNVLLYYRVDPYDDVAPLQQLTNQVTAAYDSLAGASGAQTAPQGANGELGGARRYVTQPAQATIQIIPVEVPPKQILRVSNSTLATPPQSQPVSIGEELEFELRALIPVAQLRNFVLRDELPAGLSCADAPVVDLNAPPYAAAGFRPGGVFTPTCTPTEVTWNFGNQTVTQSPRADRRFDFRIRFIARVDNVASNQNGALLRNGGSATVATVSYVDEAGNPVVIPIGEAAAVVAEPTIALTKAFSVASADAGDLPRLTVTATNTGTAAAYNLRVLDDLSAVDLTYAGDIQGTTPPTADVTTFGAERPVFGWPQGFGIAPGATVSFSFAVQVDGTAEPHQILANTIQARWTSLPSAATALNPSGQIGPDGSPSGMRIGALPNAADPLNDYEAQASAQIEVPGAALDKLDVNPAFVPEIGAHKPFEILAELPEGTTQNLVVSDELDAGAVSYVLANNADFDVTYEFTGIASINGQAPGEAVFTAFPADGTSGTAAWSIGTLVTLAEDDLATQALQPAIRIRYFARVNNDLATNVGSSLQNGALASYTNGQTGATEARTDATPAVVAIESAFTATKTLSNVTPGKAATDPAALDDIFQYVVTVANGGNATAYDGNVVDTLPAEVRLLGAFTPTVTIGGAPVTGFVATPAGAPAGPLVWGRENGDASLDVQGGASMVITYRVIVTAPPAQSSLITNGVLIDWTSLDAPSVYERSGDGCPTITLPNDYCIGPVFAQVAGEPLPPANALRKENTQATAAVGAPFRYRITVPTTPYPRAIYDVRITDDLPASSADLRFVSVTRISGSEPWTPVNTGTPTSLVIEDPATGIDIPAGEQIVIEIEVVLENTPRNVAGLTFANTADYTYSLFDGDDASQLPGAPGTSAPMTILEPVLTLEKSGPPLMTIGTPAAFSLDVHNPSGATAWSVTILDRLPDGATGGMCDAAATGVTAQLFQADGTTPASPPLVQGIDYTLAFAGAPDCLVTLTFPSDAAAIGPDQRLIVGYQARLDADTQNGASHTNVAGATQWFSAASASPDRRTHTRALTDGTVGALDHEDAHTLEGRVNTPVLFAAKSVVILADAGTPKVVDPGDVLRYTITVKNSGGVAAQGALLTDGVPANTTYVPDSTTLNGLPVGRPDSGASPLASGIPISSSDLTPPLPGPGAGTITPDQSAVLVFDLRVNDGVPGGTLISNQAVVRSNPSLDVLTDGDGNPATGPEPTVVVVGDGQQVLITKQVSVVGGAAALAGSVLEYTVTALNISTVPALGVVITDDLDAATPGLLTLVAGSEALNGAAAGVTVAGSVLTAHYAGTYGPLGANAPAVLRFRATIDAGAAMGTTVTNTGVVTWNTPPETASASVSVDVGGTPGVGLLRGTAWHDADSDDALDAGERLLAGWIVELFDAGALLQSAVTAADGTYQIGGVAPNAATGAGPGALGVGVGYELRFRAPDAGAQSGKLGLASSVFTNGLQEIRDIVVPPGAVLPNLDLPIDPNGVVYASIQRTPVAGARVTLLDASSQSALPASCFDDPVQQGQVTRADGYYKFDLNFTDAACPSGGSYVIAVVPPGPSFTPNYSTVIPPISSPATAPLDVPACPGSANDAVPSTAAQCEAASSEFAPPSSVPPRSAGTNYHVHLLLDGAQVPGSSQIFNNHIPLDALLEEVVGIRKTTPSVNVIRGQLVPYEITLTTDEGVDIPDLSIVDRLPAGFSYVEVSAQIDDGTTVEKVEPMQNGHELVWTDVGTGIAGVLRLRLLLAVGAGVSEGEFVNRAQAVSSITGEPLSGEASATVRVTADPTFDCTDVLGKVFDDANDNGLQDDGERGLAGVRVATARGLVATSDRYGRFHITCAIVPREDRGSNFILKLDDRTLPSGYRMTTRQVQVQRATRGKALVFHFGASIQRVVGLDVADAVFEPGTTEMRLHWKPRIGLLIEELAKEPAILRLSYLADVEDEGLVERRFEAITREIRAAWATAERYELTIETAVYWRRGGPPDGSRPRAEKGSAWQTLESLLPSVDAGPPAAGASPGRSTERQLWSDEPFRRWSQDPALLERRAGDRVEQQQVVTQQPKTLKLKNIVPPIRFESGVASIPPGYIEKLRKTLEEMRDLDHVRLHLVGHADAQPLSPTLSRLYGGNEGLSQERSGEVAEFLQRALGLPPEAISFAWAGDAQPIASNATAEGRAQNRRVEVEVWYDEREEKLALEDVVVPEEIKRFKVCRTETVCKLRYLEGHERRARVRNLIPPLYYGEEAAVVPGEFMRQVQEALQNLRDKQNVTVKFIGFTDDAPLTGRNERIYGDPLALSKARAQRVALVVREALDLPTAAVASDGLGSSRPLAPNDTERGRSLNRRVEVEFWHDDPLQELPDEPRPCPGEAGAEVVTRVHEPASGPLASLPIEGGEAQIPPGYTETLRRVMADVADKTHVRLRFVGYTRDETLDRRTAVVYGDDIGLSAARARRTMEKIQAEMGLADEQVEHEGRGYVHANDVVNAGFVQGDSSYVAVQVVYDELAVPDDYHGVDVTRITRELFPNDPLALNLMRITVDGEPIDDPGRSVADIQRCTDVALENADIQFRFDDLETVPRLSVTSQPIATPAAREGTSAGAVRFRMYTNYWPSIVRSEVRIFEQGQSTQAEPLAVVPIGPEGGAEWQPPAESFAGPVRERVFVLRAYDAEGRFDETSPQSLWRIYAEPAAPAPPAPGLDPLLAGYGETGPLARNIALGSTGTVQVHGSGIPPQHSVWLAGSPVPVDAHGNFAAEVVLPSGLHTVEVAVLDEAGNGELFLRDLAFEKSDWFYVAMADLTVAPDLSGGPPSALTGKHAPYDEDSLADGRLAFYVNGKFGEDWRLTASADTREEPVEELVTNFLDKSPNALFRRIDPDYHYPTFGDDGTVEEMAPTQGKLFAKLSKDESHALWGNFKVGYFDNELAQVDRGLYGGNVHYQSPATTSFGDERVAVDGFAAEPGTVQSREAFRGTGGSLYYLRHQDVLIGSERLRIELRDKASGLVTSVVYLRPTLDYDIDYLQGRVLLTEPLGATADDDLLVRSQGLSGNDAFLVVQYEFTPSFDELKALAAGGQGHVWATDFLKLGLTASKNDGTGSNSTLYAGDVTLRASADSWLKLQAGRSEGLVSTTLASEDGGFAFFGPPAETLGESDANAYRADVSFAMRDWIEAARGRLSLYAQNLEGGYSAPGQNALTDTQNYGGTLQVPVTDALDLTAKTDWQLQDDGLEIRAEEVDLGYQLSEGWWLGTGVRNELREDDSPVEPATQEEGERTDAVAQIGYDAKGRWRAYGFGQGTLAKSGDRDANHRGGVGGAYRISDRLLLEGETSYGNFGPAVELGTSFQQTEETRRYLSYAYENERGYDGLHERTGNLISGMRTRLSDSSSAFMEDRYKHGDTSTGVARTVGITLAPSDPWSVTGHWELGDLFNRETNAETKRRAGGALVGYGFDRLQLSSGVEYRYDDSEQLDGSWTDRTTWLFRNTLRYQLIPDVRIVGKYNQSFSDSSEGQFFDGRFTEAVIGAAYRPVSHDRLNVLARYTYFYNFPTADQVTLKNTPVEFIQKSNVASIDATYDLTENFKLGAKYAYRLGQASLDRDDPEFFDNNAHLAILRGDYRFLKYWEGSVEGRVLDLPDANERRSGAALTFYQYLGEHFKVGVGYNFTDFSEDMTDLSYDDHGLFFNVVGSM